MRDERRKRGIEGNRKVVSSGRKKGLRVEEIKTVRMRKEEKGEGGMEGEGEMRMWWVRGIGGKKREGVNRRRKGGRMSCRGEGKRD